MSSNSPWMQRVAIFEKFHSNFLMHPWLAYNYRRIGKKTLSILARIVSNSQHHSHLLFSHSGCIYFRTLVEACSDGDVGAVRKLLGEGRSVNETNEEGESLLSLACSAGYYELAQVIIFSNLLFSNFRPFAYNLYWKSAKHFIQTELK